MNERQTLVLTQYRKGNRYENILGHLYQFPKSYLNHFQKLPLEFIYYEPIKNGKGEFFGNGKVDGVIIDNNADDIFFATIKEYQAFSRPVSYRSQDGQLREGKNPHYNPQNAVRKIPSNLFDEICLDGGIQLYFKADAHLVKVLGEQLIGSEKVGILELVKNAIDANASYCKIRIEKISDLPPASDYQFDEFEGPVIVIEDDGIGMDKETIEKGWLRPASTLKANVKELLRFEREKFKKEGKLGSYNTLIKQLQKEKGKIPLGEKGVGRFATHRLGKNLLIKTKPKNTEYEYVLKINWDLFDQYSETPIDLESIGVELERQNLSRDYGETKSGTQIIIYGGREGFSWDRKKIEEINESILRLNSPNPNPNKLKQKFKAFVECPQIEDLPQLQIHENFEPNFTLDAIVNDDGIIEEYTLDFNPPKAIPLPKETWTDKDYDLRIPNIYWRTEGNQIRKPVCGSFYIHLDAWIRTKDWIEAKDWSLTPDHTALTQYLSDFGGISIYRDNIIIATAEQGKLNDWLGLAQRQIKQTFRISYYNMIGNIEIDQTENFDLIDTTNREGMIKNSAYNDLAQLVITIIQNILEVKFTGKRDEYKYLTDGLIRDPKKLSGMTKQSSIIIKGVKDNYPIENDPWNILHQLGSSVDERKTGLVNLENSIKNLKNSIKVIEDVQEMLTEHAGFGIAAAVSLHELTKITTNFYNGISHLLKSGQIDKFKLEDLKIASASLKSELKRLGPLRAIRNEPMREFNIVQSINYASEIFKQKIKKNEIIFEVNSFENFSLYARYATLNQILANLFDNSIYWILLSGNTKKRIKIQLNKKCRTLLFSDSGTNIDPVIRQYLFEPGYSLKIPPSGLGLYICKSYMHAANGDIHETISRERLPEMEGAQFTLEFENVPQSKEMAK